MTEDRNKALRRKIICVADPICMAFGRVEADIASLLCRADLTDMQRKELQDRQRQAETAWQAWLGHYQA